jgi:hypothetical protein
MSLSCIQAANLLLSHAIFSKMAVSFGVRVYCAVETDSIKKNKYLNKPVVQEFCKAQLNEAEYAALIIAPLLYLHAVGAKGSHWGATLAVLGQVGYVWARAFVGMPSVPAMVAATVRYAGLILISLELWNFFNL